MFTTLIFNLENHKTGSTSQNSILNPNMRRDNQLTATAHYSYLIYAFVYNSI